MPKCTFGIRRSFKLHYYTFHTIRSDKNCPRNSNFNENNNGIIKSNTFINIVLNTYVEITVALVKRNLDHRRKTTVIIVILASFVRFVFIHQIKRLIVLGFIYHYDIFSCSRVFFFAIDVDKTTRQLTAADTHGMVVLYLWCPAFGLSTRST